MNILIIPSWYKTPDSPTIGTFFEEQARMLKRRGISVGVLYPIFELSFKKRIISKIIKFKDFDDKGIPTYYSFGQSIVPKWQSINYWYCSVLAYRKFKQYVEKYGQPDIIHAHSLFMGGIVAEYLSRRTGIPFLITEHYSGLVLLNKYKHRANVKALMRVFQNSQRNIIVSNNFKRILNEQYKDSFEKVVVPNVVNPIFFNLKVKKKSFPFRFFANASLTENKNIHLLLESFSLLENEIHEIELIIAGDGPLRKKLIERAKFYDIEEKVTFLGNISRINVAEQLLNAHSLVSVSKFETFGINIIEALAMGRPVIATNSGGPIDIITSCDGIIVNKNTSQSVANAMKQIITNYDDYNQIKISEHCYARFSEEVISGKLLSIYEKIHMQNQKNRPKLK